MSTQTIRRNIPLLIAFLVGMLMVVEWFFVPTPIRDVARIVSTWGIIIAAFASGVGAVNLLIRSYGRITSRKGYDWIYAAYLLAIFFLFLIVGIGYGSASNQFNWIYNTFLLPCSATSYAITLFLMASAMYRLFKARSLEGGVLLTSAFIILLMNTTSVTVILPGFLTIGNWIMDVLVTPAYRSIIMGIGLGSILIGFRTLLGMERGYLGGETG